MHLNVCFMLLLLSITLVQAGPTPKIVEKKSLMEDVKAESKTEDLKLKETGEEKGRSKKSAFCVQIESGTSQPAQVSWKDNQASAQKIPMALQTQPIPQQVQTISVIQPVPQTLPQASITMPQQVIQPIHTLQIVQTPPPPCIQSAPAVNIIQSVPQSNIVKSVQKTKPKPKPVPAPATEVKIVTEKPMRIVQDPQPLPEPQQTLAALPIAPSYHSNMITVPSNSMILVEPKQSQLAAIVQVPSMSPCSNPLHSFLNPCPCQASIEPLAMKVLPVTTCSSSFASSPLIMPYESKTLSDIAADNNVNIKPGPQGRTHALLHMNFPHHIHHPHHLSTQTVYQNTYVKGLEPAATSYVSKDLVDEMYPTKGITINAFPQTFLRQATPLQQPGYISAEGILKNEGSALNNPVASEAHDLMQRDKTPNEFDSNQLVPERIEEIKQDKGRALLIDSRRNVRSNKEKTKEDKVQSKAN